MTALIFLGGALGVFVLFGLVSWFRHRETSVTFESSIETFKREMGVLAPDDEPEPDHAGNATDVARDLAIDLGTANTLVYAGVAASSLNEPSVIALNNQTSEVLAMGHEAWQMIGRTPSYIVAVRPLRKGAITDFDVTQRMIRLLLQRVGVSPFNRPRVVICVPSAITAVERRAVTEAARGPARPMLN